MKVCFNKRYLFLVFVLLQVISTHLVFASDDTDSWATFLLNKIESDQNVIPSLNKPLINEQNQKKNASIAEPKQKPLFEHSSITINCNNEQPNYNNITLPIETTANKNKRQRKKTHHPANKKQKPLFEHSSLAINCNNEQPSYSKKPKPTNLKNTTLLITAKTLLQDASIHKKNKEYEQAITLYESARKKDNSKQTQSCVLFNLGLLHELQGKRDIAIKYYQEASNTYNYPEAINNLGCLYFKEKNYKKSQECFQKGASLNHPESTFNLAKVHIQAKEYKQAIALLKHCLDKHKMVNILNTLGYIYQKNNQLAQAKESYKKAANKHNDFRAMNNLALLYEKQGKFDNARKYYQRAIEKYNYERAKTNLNILERRALAQKENKPKEAPTQPTNLINTSFAEDQHTPTFNLNNDIESNLDKFFPSIDNNNPSDQDEIPF